MKKALAILMVFIICLSMAACTQTPDNNQNNDENNQTDPGNTQDDTQNNNPDDTQNTNEGGNAPVSNPNNPIATLTMADGKTISIELFPDVAPQSVYNFISLANSGFYNGLIFHRIIAGFMVQGGCPDGMGTGGPGYNIKGEFELNGVKNDISHVTGVLSMARSNAYDSAGSQFFICVSDDDTFLDGNYAGFGRVVDGIEVALDLSRVITGVNDRPVEEQKIQSITVDTKGVEYPAPTKLDDAGKVIG